MGAVTSPVEPSGAVPDPQEPALRVSAQRVLALWCPDWPASAAAADSNLAPDAPVAVLHANRVVACSASARRSGVRRGMRKRQAQAACPEMVLAGADAGRDGQQYEPIVAAVMEVVPVVEVLRPGLLVIPLTMSLCRHLGDEQVIAERLTDVVGSCGAEALAGIADEMFTAVLAARRGQCVEPGGDAAWLAPLPVAELAVEPCFGGPERAELVDLLRRLGITTIGVFAGFPIRDVATRFNADAVAAHRLANAAPARGPVGGRIEEDLVIEYDCDPQIDRVDAAAFVGRRLADELHRRLAAVSMSCTRLTVEAVTELGQRHSRTWRAVTPLTADDMACRIRWQLDGWLTGGRTTRDHRTDVRRPDSPIALLRIDPVEVIDSGTLHYTLSGYGLPESEMDSERARTALARVQGLLGGDAVKIPVLSGGRGPADRIRLVTLGEDPVPQGDPLAPWPGRLPQPAPATMTEVAVAVLDPEGDPVRVSARGAFSAEPALVVGSRKWSVRWWAGPWPTGLDADGTEVSARAQILLDDSRALLLHYREGSWTIEGIYE